MNIKSQIVVVVVVAVACGLWLVVFVCVVVRGGTKVYSQWFQDPKKKHEESGPLLTLGVFGDSHKLFSQKLTK
jgi:hypothetical protein